jgi:hypothetical protein
VGTFRVAGDNVVMVHVHGVAGMVVSDLMALAPGMLDGSRLESDGHRLMVVLVVRLGGCLALRTAESCAGLDAGWIH